MNKPSVTMESDVDLLSKFVILQTNTFLTEAFPRHRVACLFSLVENRRLLDFDIRKQQLATIKSQPAYWCSMVQEMNRHHPFVPSESGKQRGQMSLQFTKLQCNVCGNFAICKLVLMHFAMAIRLNPSEQKLWDSVIPHQANIARHAFCSRR